jgi:hypothetical protein
MWLTNFASRELCIRENETADIEEYSSEVVLSKSRTDQSQKRKTEFPLSSGNEF